MTKAKAHPGGAPIKEKKKPACKYGPRDADGFCPKKPKAAKTARKKPPCKYGPRDADGYCPKKPSAAREPTSDSIFDKKIPQGYTSSGREKSTTLRKVGEKVAIQAAENATRKAVDAGIKAYNDPAYRKRLQDIAAGALPFALKFGKVIGVLGVAAALVVLAKQAAVATATRDLEKAQIAAYNTVEDIHARMSLTAPQFNALLEQYTTYYLTRVRLLRLANK